MEGRRWTLLGADGRPCRSEQPGTLGGYRATRIYGRLDCRTALRALARGGYAPQRVFFLDEATARAAGYRPCAVCMPAAYAAWKAARTPVCAPAGTRCTTTRASAGAKAPAET